MIKQTSLKLNFIMNSLLKMSSFIFPLITFPYVSRILLPDGTGKVNFALSFVSYFTMFAQLGIPTYGVRVCAMERDNQEKLTRTAHELLLINLITGTISYVCFFAAVFFIPALREDRLLYIIVSFNILLSAIGMEWLYKALEQYTYITVRSLTFKVIALLAMFLLIHEKKDYVIYGGIAIFAGCASNFVNFIHVRRYIGMRPVGKYHLRQHMKAVEIFFAMSCATTIYLHLDTIMLKFMASDADVGYYSAATKFKSILTSIVTSLGAVLLPRVSYFVREKKMNAFRRVIQKTLNFVFLLAVPLMCYFILYAKESIYFISGEAYRNAVMPMRLIMPTLLCIGITNILGIQILVPLGMEKIVLYSEIAGAVTDMILNALLIPLFKSSGAAVGTVIAEIVVLAVQYACLRKEVNPVFQTIRYDKILIAVLMGVIASLWVKWLALNSFLTLLISLCLFFFAYGAVLILLKEELVMELLKQIFTKRLKRNQYGKTKND